MRTKTTMFAAVGMFSGLAMSGYGCKQVIGWHEPHLREADGGLGGAGGSGGGGGSGGAGGSGGGGGIGGGGGSGGVGGGVGGSGGMPQCTTEADCPGGMNGAATCVGGVCGFACTSGFEDCDGVVGCEVELATDRKNCGACGNKCFAQCKVGSCNDPVSLGAGYQHNCAILKDGQLYCWGRNEKGELGDGTLATKYVPTKVNLPGGLGAVQVAGAGYFGGTYTARTYAMLTDKTIAEWGDGNPTPKVVAGISNVKQISVGAGYRCAIDLNQTLYCWGFNLDGQLGTGDTNPRTVPTQIATGVIQVSAGASHTCAIKIGGALQCWGNNSKGQLGIGSTTSKYVPTTVAALPFVDEVQVSDEHTCARGPTGTHCWGSNVFGQLGIGNYSNQSTPQVLTLLGTQGLALGYGNSGAVVDGSVWMWGNNSGGKLGNGSQTIATSPVQIALTNTAKLALSSNSSCALGMAGEVKCWGDNTYGQLGNNTSVGKWTPTAVVWP